jgi:hypothetical protein
MKHPFKVGGRYRNRKGEYEVIRLEEPNMVIRLSNGTVIHSSIELQARIWENIQAEESLSTLTRSPQKRPSKGKQRGLKFSSLREHDFQEGVTGTSWRAKTGLGGLLAQRMSDTTQHYFGSYPIYRWPEVHIAQPAYYDISIRLREAKFAFGLNIERAWYGFYIEKNDGPMDDTWDWLRFISALGGDTALQAEVEKAMRQLELRWEVYIWDEGGLIAQMTTRQDDLVWQRQDQEPEAISWDGFAAKLRAIEIEKWCDLFLCTHMDKNQAIEAGIRIVDPVTEVYRALLPLYETSTRRAV